MAIFYMFNKVYIMQIIRVFKTIFLIFMRTTISNKNRSKNQKFVRKSGLGDGPKFFKPSCSKNLKILSQHSN